MPPVSNWLTTRPPAVYPMAIDAAGQDLVMVGRIREDGSIENGLNLWVVADNIRKGRPPMRSGLPRSSSRDT